MSIAVKAKSGKDSEESRHPFAIDPPLHPSYDLRDVIRLALKEDSGNQGDVTCMATVPSELEVEGHFLAKEDGVIAGIALADMIFEEVDPSLETCWFKEDGDSVHRNVRFGKVCGRARSIIVAERVALNFMQRMSGIATQTKAMSEAAYPAVVLETRKTAPCLRVVDKWAVLIGGGENHRMGLFDAVLVKDNHVTSAGGVTEALSAVDRYLRARNLKMNVVVEARTLGEVEEVLRYPDGSRLLTRIMLDNMVFPLPDGGLDTSLLRRAVSLIAGRFEIEASGNVTLEALPAIAKTGVTHISSGALTHSVKALDISLKILVNAPS